MLDLYQIDPLFTWPLPGFAWQAALKHTKITLELLTDTLMYTYIERGIRGGVSQICHRYAKYEAPPDDQHPGKYLMYLDANNLYGHAMSQYLPVRCFEWMKDCDVALVSSETILAMSESAQSGMILEVDLEYPDCLHDQHRDFPLAPEHLTITSNMLSDYQKSILQQNQTKHHESRKLVPNLYPKSHYIVHYINLKFYLSHGLKLTKIHRILRFQQEPWLKSFITFNTLQRSLATSKFSKDLFKLINNATFGKTMENVRNRRTITLVSTSRQLEKLSSQPTFKSFRIFSENLIAVERYASSLCLNKPIYSGFSVLDLSKQHMYKFH